MSDDELARHQKFVFAKDRERFLLTRGLLRHTLSRYHPSVNPEQWRFTYNEFGKPSIGRQHGPIPLRFNISHSHNMIIIAVANSISIGVDVEWINTQAASESLAEYALSAAEFSELKSKRIRPFAERFFEFWTLKEAYIKACGKGLSIPLDSFSFCIDDVHGISFKQETHLQEDHSEKAQAWHFLQYRLHTEYLVALAIPTMKTMSYVNTKFMQISAEGEPVNALLPAARRSTGLLETATIMP